VGFEFLPADEKYAPDAAFLGLWAVQAALAAVVYPIVVAFITILLQKQQASKASLHAYFATSAAKLVGSLSLGLVLLMGVQLVFLDTTKPLVGFVWLLLDAAWFAINVLLTGYFLYTTFDFASPEGRTRARNRYVLTRGWPAEWTFHVSRIVSRSPAAYDLVDLPTVPTTARPALTVAPLPRLGTPAMYMRFRGKRTVSGYRFRLLESAYHFASKSIHHKDAIFCLPYAYGDEFAATEPIVRLQEIKPLSVIARTLVRMAMSTTRHSPRPRVTVSNAIEEMRADAADCISADATADFERRLRELHDFYTSVLEASFYVSRGVADNWALMLDTLAFGDQTLSRQWEQAFLDIHRSALTSMSVRSNYAERTIRAGYRCIAGQSRFSIERLKNQHLWLQYRLLYDALEWGAENATQNPPGVFIPQVPPEPFLRRYETLLVRGVGAWESIKNFDTLIVGRRSQNLDWERYRQSTPLFEAHAKLTALLVRRAVASRDLLGFRYFCDSLLKWSSQLEHFRDSGSDGIALGSRFLVTTALFERGLNPFREFFPLPSYLTESDRTVRSTWFLAITNYWRDVVVTLVASCITQDPNSSSLTAHVVRHVLLGEPILADSTAARQEQPFKSADVLLQALVRQLVDFGVDPPSYSSKIETVAKDMVVSPASAQMEGRVFSWFGTSMDRLLDGQLAMLCLLAVGSWTPSGAFDSLFRALRSQDPERQHLGFVLKRWRQRIREKGFFDYISSIWSIDFRENIPPLEAQINLVDAALNSLETRLQALRTVELLELNPTEEAIAELATYASHGISGPSSIPLPIPLRFFGSVAFSKESAPPDETAHVFRLVEYDKGQLTEPKLSIPPVNNEEWFREFGRAVVSADILGELIAKANAPKQEISSIDEFVETVTRFGKLAVDAGHKPILLVSSHADPPWLLDMTRYPEDEEDKKFELTRDGSLAQDADYIGHLGDTAIYVGPVSASEGLLCTKALFGALVIYGGEAQPITGNWEPEPGGLTCTVTFSWRRRVAGGEGPAMLLQYRLSSQLAS
jgi:hypothetical protein